MSYSQTQYYRSTLVFQVKTKFITANDKLPFLKKRVPFSQSKHDSKAVQHFKKTEMTVALM